VRCILNVSEVALKLMLWKFEHKYKRKFTRGSRADIPAVVISFYSCGVRVDLIFRTLQPFHLISAYFEVGLIVISVDLLSALRPESVMTRSLSTANPTARFKQGFLRVLNFKVEG
jgi:hypothetical protein